MKLLARFADFPIRHSLLIVLAFLAVMIVSYFFVDKSIAAFFHQGPVFLVSFGRFINDIIDPAPNVLLWPLIFYVVYFLLKKRALGSKILLIAISVNAANAVVIPVKMFFGRYRPELWFSQHLYGFDFFDFQNSELSFPSGHAVTIFAVMFSLSCLYPKRFALFLFIGFVLAFARVVVDAHYLSDIIASMLIGFILSQCIYRAMQKTQFSHL